MSSGRQYAKALSTRFHNSVAAMVTDFDVIGLEAWQTVQSHWKFGGACLP